MSTRAGSPPLLHRAAKEPPHLAAVHLPADEPEAHPADLAPSPPRRPC